MRQFLLAIDLVDIAGDDIKVGLKCRRRLIGVFVIPRFKALYERLRAAGKPAKVALVAVMRKMIVSLNAMEQTEMSFLTWHLTR